ncbi:hypothetical protein Lal_00019322 [Lupinus albus]|uniref:Putative K domain-containing protein n=1 Tax=Lupinus albus TaxID=3870 RepID=A0A6A4R6I3_LUPAL|nr:putative K domain-containing protein [Lupinus albus]KAF1899200.1 hypothetical protein Lal_00019322 [Lupinus albus]
MDSTESSYLSSVEPPTNAPLKSPPSSSSDFAEKPTYVRFLVSNSAAGSVIGKGGSTITDFQSQSGARIQLSRNHEFFPGTTDRIIMVSGAINEVLKGVELIISKLLSEVHSENDNDAEPKSKVRLVVPNGSCGRIIGKGGATIRSFIEDSQAGIKISPQDNNYFGINDRLVTPTGTLDEQMHAVDLIVSKLSEDPHYSQSINSPMSYPGISSLGYHGAPSVLPSGSATAYNPSDYITNGPGGKFENSKEERSNSLTIGVLDGHVGFVVGRGGRNIMEISQTSGARVKISDRGDYISGTSERKVTITGSQRAIRTAESMILKKVAYAAEKAIEVE